MTKSSNSHFNVVVIISLGGLLETYDFLIYALMSPYISQLFFPAEEMTNSLLMTFIIFSVGYLSRPLGGALFGHQGDHSGRKKPFTWTILLMASATFLMGCLPVYDQVGIWAPAILILLRLLQGISMGGEVGGAFTYLSESTPQRRATVTAAAMCGMSLGFVVGHLVHALLLYLLQSEGMFAGGWRIPFILGGILGIVGYIIRKNFQETAAFRQLQKKQEYSLIPIKTLFAKYPLNVLCGIFCIAIHSITLVLFIIFFPSYLQAIHPEKNLAAVGGLAMFIAAVSVIPVGIWLDKIDIRKVLKVTISSELLLGLPLVWLLFEQPQLTAAILIISSLQVALNAATLITLTTTLFPTAVRYSGIAVSYNLGFAIGGFTPVLATLLPGLLGYSWAAGYLLLGCGILGIVTLKIYDRLKIPFPLNQKQSRLSPT
ncbi:MFS transporter [Endozoicomonadaceae bacterium StTr2]